ncbi:hypothetical protein DPMN_175800 [Dreissena polymorpha]|uniref:Uncharacterized protein n=1 Tax=Dreissena polymorpha TaxID=45954 RepID=A0A9D4E7Y4_DREPO|nr:hypothetical protein DPMN_175800 [Dreissena polymorpha]
MDLSPPSPQRFPCKHGKIPKYAVLDMTHSNRKRDLGGRWGGQLWHPPHQSRKLRLPSHQEQQSCQLPQLRPPPAHQARLASKLPQCRPSCLPPGSLPLWSQTGIGNWACNYL